ncbi:MAG: hypothetical protein ACK5WZ_00095 [Pseudobdellovibrionaceae bacterium]
MRSFLLILLFPISLFSEIKLIFFETQKADGSLVQFENEGRFTHMAVSYGDLWLHSHPYYGVEAVPFHQIQKMGSKLTIVSLSTWKQFSEEEVLPYMGKTFDREFSWTDEKIYCSELIAKLLGIPPTPMFFHPDLWPSEYQKLNGQPGTSPDDIFQWVNSQPTQ